MKIGFIGAGNIAYSLIKCLGDKVEVIIVSDLSEKKLAFIEENTIAQTTTRNLEVVEETDVIFLCVKPNAIDKVLFEIKDKLDKQIIISVAAGVKIDRMQFIIRESKVIRLMPNVNGLVGEIAGAYSIGEKIVESDVIMIDNLFDQKLFKVDEAKLPAVTALSGSGPAYFAWFIKHLIESGIENGLEENVAKDLAVKTMLGTAKLLADKNSDDLIKMVASPGGTTEAALNKADPKLVKEIFNAALNKSKDIS